MNPSVKFGTDHAATDNPTPIKDVYPTASGATLGIASGAETMATTDGDAGSGGGAAMVSANGLLGQPITWWGGLIVLFIALGLVAKRAGNAGDFGNLKVSAYNILMITIAAVIGIVSLKVLFTRFPVPGISPLVAAV